MKLYYSTLLYSTLSRGWKFACVDVCMFFIESPWKLAWVSDLCLVIFSCIIGPEILTPRGTSFCTPRIEGSCISAGMQVRELLMKYKVAQQPHFRGTEDRFHLSRNYPTGAIIIGIISICFCLFASNGGRRLLSQVSLKGLCLKHLSPGCSIWGDCRLLLSSWDDGCHNSNNVLC